MTKIVSPEFSKNSLTRNQQTRKKLEKKLPSKAKKINKCFSGHFFEKPMRQADLIFIFYFPKKQVRQIFIFYFIEN